MNERGVPAWVQVGFVLLLIVGAWWYTQVYDTAAGKCNRGDLNACIVYQAQHPTAGPAVAATADAGAFDNLTPVDYSGTYDCYAWVPNHDAVAGIKGGADQCTVVQSILVDHGFTNPYNVNVPAGDRRVCSIVSSRAGWAVDIWDSGGASYGSDACRVLAQIAGGN